MLTLGNIFNAIMDLHEEQPEFATVLLNTPLEMPSMRISLINGGVELDQYEQANYVDGSAEHLVITEGDVLRYLRTVDLL